jgi:serine/threonine protein kinase/tetratricopeptide (TPR) repeat protein/TolB-like protein
MADTEEGTHRKPTTERVNCELTPERWQEIKTLVLGAQGLNAVARERFLQEACGPDHALRTEVESLLAAESDRDGARVSTSTLLERTGLPYTADPMVGRRLGAYELIRQIGHGGMATVYLAARADDAFHKQVAIKLVHLGTDNAEILSRFRKERQTLAALDHPNIVRLMDGGSSGEGMPYLVMDVVEGLPIDEYCDRHLLPVDQRLNLFYSVCGAVHYAHQHLVVHRDLKPSNVLVTSDGVPKLLDFGIAKVLNPKDSKQGLQVTQTNLRRMTPAYASPEQVRGERVTPASDIYSLGVVLYELLTGHRPYRLRQPTPAQLESAICDQDPENPSTAVDRVETETSPDGTTVSKTPETISRTREGPPDKLRRRLRGDLDNIVLMALRKDPQQRYASAKELADDIQRHLDHIPVKARPSTLAYRISKFVRRRKTEAIAGALVMVILLAAAGFLIIEERIVAERGKADIVSRRSGGRRALAVLGFKNLSGRPSADWLSTALSEMLTTELAAGGTLRMIPGEDVAQTRINLSLPEMDSFNSATLHRIYKNLGSDYVVAGTFVATGEDSHHLRLDLRVQDAVLGDTIAVAAENGDLTDLAGLVGRAGASLRGKLGVLAPSSSESAGRQVSLPATSEAARYYAEGLEKQRLYDFRGARESLEKAVAADPNFALAHMTLSDAWASVGEIKRSQEEAKKGFDLSSGLPREQSLMVEARYYEALHQWDKAIEIRRTLFSFFPDNLNHGLQLASTQTAAGKGEDSLATIENLRKLPAPDRDDPRIDLAESHAANVVSDYKREAATAERTIQKAQAIGARQLVAQARISEARAFMELGQKEKVGPALTEAQEIYKAVGDRFHQARVSQQVGLAYYYQGKLEEAKKTYFEALAIQRELGNRSNEAKLLNGIAMVLAEQNDLEGAQQDYLQALTICREIDDRAMTGTVLSNLAGIQEAQGDFQGAKSHLQESLDIARRVGEQSGIAVALENLGTALVGEGDLLRAKANYEEALKVSRKTGKNKDITTILIDRGDLQMLLGDLSGAYSSYLEAQRIATTANDQQAVAIATASLGDVRFEQGDLSAARKSYEQSLDILQRIASNRFVQNANMAQSRLELETGDSSTAEAKARRAADEFRKAEDLDDLAKAEVLLCQTLLAQQKIEEARNIAEDARKAADHGGTRAAQLAVETVLAEVQTASAHPPDAVQTLQSVVAECREGGFFALELEARLAMARAEIKAGSRNSGRSQLASTAHDAKSKGFNLIAQRAEGLAIKY